MIRFRTIDPADQARADEKAPAAQPAAAHAAPAEDAQTVAEETTETPSSKAKGLTRKTPLRNKKPATSGLFRD